MTIYPQYLKNHLGTQVAVIYEDNIHFIPESPVKESLICSGILIPQNRSNDFDGRVIIHLKDSKFSKAFCEIYFPHCLQESGFTLTPS
ncbi:MAG: hypothetical protein FJZ59_04300 [Chlamydiae bacterium]|nr:hypothetical protein [Chlamydiota bacterium]